MTNDRVLAGISLTEDGHARIRVREQEAILPMKPKGDGWFSVAFEDLKIMTDEEHYDSILPKFVERGVYINSDTHDRWRRDIENLKALAKELWAARLPAALGEGTEARILERFPWIGE